VTNNLGLSVLLNAHQIPEVALTTIIRNAIHTAEPLIHAKDHELMVKQAKETIGGIAGRAVCKQCSGSHFSFPPAARSPATSFPDT
jgi:hypothetical protein